MRKPVTALFLVLLLAHGAFCQTSQPQSDGRIEIPFRMVEGVIWLDVSVNGSQPLHFVLDTASGDDVIDRDRAGELKLPLIELGERPNAGTGDGTTLVAFTDNVEFSVGSDGHGGHRVGCRTAGLPDVQGDAGSRRFACQRSRCRGGRRVGKPRWPSGKRVAQVESHRGTQATRCPDRNGFDAEQKRHARKDDLTPAGLFILTP